MACELPDCPEHGDWYPEFEDDGTEAWEYRQDWNLEDASFDCE